MRKNPFVRLTIAIGSMLAAFFLERLLAVAFGPHVPVPPLVLIAVVWWLPVFPLSSRLWLAGMAGMLIDTFGGQTFGVSILVILLAGLLAEAFRSIISARDWGIGHVSVSVALAVSALVLMPIAEAAMLYTHRLFS